MKRSTSPNVSKNLKLVDVDSIVTKLQFELEKVPANLA